MKTCPKQLFTNKLDNLGEIEKFLGRHKLLTLTQKGIENPSRILRSKEIKLTPI